MLFILGYAVALRTLANNLDSSEAIWNYTALMWQANPPITAAGLIALGWTLFAALRTVATLIAIVCNSQPRKEE